MTDFPDFITALPELAIDLAGVSGHLLQGDNQQVAFIRFETETVVPEHSHRAQWEIVLAGEVRLKVAGEEHHHAAGDSFFLPAGVPHGAVVGAGYRAIIFFDQPDRYRVKD